MSTPPIVDVPESSCVAEVVMSLIRVVTRTVSPYTLEDQSFKWPGEQWKIDFTMPPMTQKEMANEWKAFGIKLQGSYGYFYMGDPSAKVPLGVATGSPEVEGSGQSGNLLATRGWTPGVSGILKAGDYIQIGTGLASRLHMVTEDVDSDTSGDADIPLEPALRFGPADSTPIMVNNPVGVFRLINNDFSWRVSPGPVYRFSFQAEEVVNA